MKNRTFYIFIMITLFFSCTIDKKYQNRESDQNDAKVIVNQFYDNFKKKKYTDIFMLFSNGNNNTLERNAKLSKIFDLAHKELGEIIDMKIDSIDTKVIEGNAPSGKYNLIYDVNHKNYITKEYFFLMLEKDTIKIIDFKINPVKDLRN